MKILKGIFGTGRNKPDLHHGEDLLFLGRYQEALLFFKRVLEDDPQNIHALSGIALSLEHIGREKDAMAVYRRILSIDADNSDALLGMAICLEKTGRFEDALSWYEKDLKKKSGRPGHPRRNWPLML